MNMIKAKCVTVKAWFGSGRGTTVSSASLAWNTPWSGVVWPPTRARAALSGSARPGSSGKKILPGPISLLPAKKEDPGGLQLPPGSDLSVRRAVARRIVPACATGGEQAAGLHRLPTVGGIKALRAHLAGQVSQLG